LRTAPRIGRIPCIVFFASVVGLLQLTWRLARPLATSPWKPEPYGRCLLVLPNRIELRPTAELPLFSPRAANAEYSFLVRPERRTWVVKQLSSYPTPTQSASWHLSVRSIDANTQEIELELLGDGFYGIVYRATTDTIVLSKLREAGPGFAFVVLGIDVTAAILVGSFALLTMRCLRTRTAPS